jgi:hypothetical protein
MKNDQSISALFAPIAGFLKRFHTLLFFLIVSGSLFLAIVSLLDIIEVSSSTSTSSDQAINGNFDKETIQKIKDGGSINVTPGKRTSPFSE